MQSSDCDQSNKIIIVNTRDLSHDRIRKMLLFYYIYNRFPDFFIHPYKKYGTLKNNYKIIII